MRIPFVSSYSRSLLPGAGSPRRARPVTLVPALVLVLLSSAGVARPQSVTAHPYPGVTTTTVRETTPRNFTAHIVEIELSTSGLRFHLTPPGGARETGRQTTLEFLRQEKAQFAINGHFFLPFPSAEPDANLIGLAVSNGVLVSDFETPAQAYALVADAPAINIDRTNHATVVHPGDARDSLWNTMAGSAQIVTHGQVTIPTYKDPEHPGGALTAGGPGNYKNDHSWYEVPQARTALGIAAGGRRLVLFVVDRAAGSQGLTVSEVARLLESRFQVDDALNLDGGGSTTLAMEDPLTHAAAIVNTSSDNPRGRSVGSNLAVFLPGGKR